MRFPDDVLAAEARIRPYTRETYLDRSPYLSEAGQAEVWVKCEHLQYTGSFKARGAMNKVLALTEAERAAGVVHFNPSLDITAKVLALVNKEKPGAK